MKRILCCILALLLIGGAALAEEGTISFDATLTNALDFDIDVWTQNEKARATLSVALLVDLGTATDSAITPDLASPTYVVQPDDKNLLVITHISDQDAMLMIMYCPQSHYAAYGLTDHDIADETLRTQLSVAYETDRVYETSPTSLVEAAAAILDALKD